MTFGIILTAIAITFVASCNESTSYASSNTNIKEDSQQVEKDLTPINLDERLSIGMCVDDVSTSLSEASGKQVPPFLMGRVDGEQISLSILPEGVAPMNRKLKGTRFINVEPGCIMLEAYVKLLGENKLEIRMSSNDGFTTQTMKKMGVTSKSVIVTFNPSKAANLAGSIVAIAPSKTKLSEQGSAL